MSNPSPLSGTRRPRLLPALPLAAQVLIGLVAGFAVGLLLEGRDGPVVRTTLAAAETIGALFVAAIRMTVVPLVVASLVVAVAGGGDARAIGALGARALVLFVVVLAAAAVLAVVAAPPLLRVAAFSAEASEALRASATGNAASETAAATARTLPGFRRWLVDLVPPNVFRAATDGAMLPLIVFALAFGVALGRVARERGAAVLRFFEGVSDAMLLLVRWILAVAPLGVFALAIPLVAVTGGAAAGALATYVAVVSGLTVIFALVVLYPLAVVGGRVAPGTFARAALPAQAVAFGSRSSLAALPAMIEGARTRLALPAAVTGFLLPLGAAAFRAGSAVFQAVAVIFAAQVYGVALSPTRLATIALTTVVTTFSIPGIPGGSVLVIVPILAAVGVPEAAIGLLLGIDVIPDMFRTTANVTGTMSVATVLGRAPVRAPAAVAAD